MDGLIAFLTQYQVPLLWLVAMIALVVVEAATTQLVSIWFAAGALAAAIAAIFGAGSAVQLVVFVVVSGVLLAVVGRTARDSVRVKRVATNADSVIGQTGTVLEAIDNLEETGRVRANGLDWTARSAAGEQIPVGQTVMVERIEGVKLVVSPKIK